MTLPAARIGDQTAHGGTIVLGFPTVLIGGKPASRIGDMHACPMVTGLVPHVGGPIVLGAFTVLTGMVPQARVSDMAVCVGPPDSIAVGEPTVLVGSAGGGGGGGFGGLAGAVLGGLFAGLRNLLSDGPRAVLQPDGSYVTQYNSVIIIRGSPEYQAIVVGDLNNLFATNSDGSATTGSRLQESLQANGHPIVIAPLQATGTQANAFATPDSTDAYMTTDSSGRRVAGSGCGSTVNYNPSLSMEYSAEDGSTQTMPPEQILGHELIHANHNGQGANMANFIDPMDPSDNLEEAQTIGVHGYETEPVSERGFHTEDERSPRPDHDSVNAMEYQDASGQWNRWETDASGNTTTTPIQSPPGGGRPNH